MYLSSDDGMGAAMTIPQQRPHTDGVDHPAWCVPALCERGPADVVHRGVGELFAPRAAASDARAPELCLEVRRLRRDELGAGGVQRVHGDEVELVRVSDGETVAVVAVEDVPRLCAVLAGGASALV